MSQARGKQKLRLITSFSLKGHETKAMLNNKGPRYKRSKIERRMNTDIFFCIGLLFLMCLIGAIGMECSRRNKTTVNFCFFGEVVSAESQFPHLLELIKK